MFSFLRFLGKYIPWAILVTGVSSFAFIMVVKQPWFSDFDAQVLIHKYSQEEIDHFASFAFQKDRITKWEEDIFVKMDSLALEDQTIIKATSDCIKRLNQMTEEIEIRFSDEPSNLWIRKVDSIDYLIRGRTSRMINLFRIPYPSLDESEILLMTKNKLTGTMSEEDVYALICHEFAHSLGFNHNFDLFNESKWTYKSWFNGATKTWNDTICAMIQDFQDFPTLDKSAIRIMYDSDVGIKPGLSKKKFYRKIQEAKLIEAL